MKATTSCNSNIIAEFPQILGHDQRRTGQYHHAVSYQGRVTWHIHSME